MPKGDQVMKKLVLALSALCLMGGVASPSIAAPACRNKAGKFVKCPAKPRVCRDAKGHYMKCR
jgi:hypothetical protein